MPQKKLQEMIKNEDSWRKNAQLCLTQTTLEKAKLNPQHTRVITPTDGFIANFNLRQSNVIDADQLLFASIEEKR